MLKARWAGRCPDRGIHMRKKTINLTFCAVFTAILFFLLILSRCHGGHSAAETAGKEEPSVPVLMYHHLLGRAENTRYQGNDIVTYVEDFERAAGVAESQRLRQHFHRPAGSVSVRQRTAARQAGDDHL